MAHNGQNLVDPFRIDDGVKMNSNKYTTLIKKTSTVWYKKKECKIMRFPYTKQFLSDCGFVGPKLLDWPAASPDLNRIENYWSALKKN